MCEAFVIRTTLYYPSSQHRAVILAKTSDIPNHLITHYTVFSCIQGRETIPGNEAEYSLHRRARTHTHTHTRGKLEMQIPQSLDCGRKPTKYQAHAEHENSKHTEAEIEPLNLGVQGDSNNH